MAGFNSFDFNRGTFGTTAPDAGRRRTGARAHAAAADVRGRLSFLEGASFGSTRELFVALQGADPRGRFAGGVHVTTSLADRFRPTLPRTVVEGETQVVLPLGREGFVRARGERKGAAKGPDGARDVGGPKRVDSRLSWFAPGPRGRGVDQEGPDGVTQRGWVAARQT